MTTTDRRAQRRLAPDIALIAGGIVVIAAGLAVMLWALLAIIAYGPDSTPPEGVPELLIAIGGFLVVSAGAELRAFGTRRLRRNRGR